MANVLVFEREDGLFDWHLIGSNGAVLCGTVQGFTERNDAVHNLMLVQFIFADGVSVKQSDEIEGWDKQAGERPG